MSNTTKAFKFKYMWELTTAQIPLPVFHTLVALWNCTDGNGHGCVGIGTLAEYCGVSRRTIERHLKWGRENGWIREMWRGRGAYASRYALVIPPAMPTPGVSDKSRKSMPTKNGKSPASNTTLAVSPQQSEQTKTVSLDNRSSVGELKDPWSKPDAAHAPSGVASALSHEKQDDRSTADRGSISSLVSNGNKPTSVPRPVGRLTDAGRCPECGRLRKNDQEPHADGCPNNPRQPNSNNPSLINGNQTKTVPPTFDTTDGTKECPECALIDDHRLNCPVDAGPPPW
jgi:hypothetical protein